MGSANLIATPMPVSRTLLSSLSFLQIWPRVLLARFQQDKLLLALVVLLPVLLWVAPTSPTVLFHLVEWHTVAALTGLMMLSRGLEDSGYLARFAGWLLSRNHSQRTLATIMVLLAAGLSAIITNDVALFVLIPICLSLARLSSVPVGRLVIVLALAVNAGSALSQATGVMEAVPRVVGSRLCY